jgi:lipopolysaccharide export system protein LptA
MAEKDVDIELGGPDPGLVADKLNAAIVTAYFSATTNQVENAVASGDVVFNQMKNGKKVHATGDRAVYELAPVERFILSGHPEATEERHLISGADRLVWEVKGGGINAYGFYHISSNPAPPAAAP